MEPVVSTQKTTSIIPAANPDSINFETCLVGFFLAAAAAGASFLGESAATTAGALSFFLVEAGLGFSAVFLAGAAAFLGTIASFFSTFFSSFFSTFFSSFSAFLSFLTDALALTTGAVLAFLGVTLASFLVSFAIFLALLGFL